MRRLKRRGINTRLKTFIVAGVVIKVNDERTNGRCREFIKYIQCTTHIYTDVPLTYVLQEITNRE
jgi:hypothetical protein